MRMPCSSARAEVGLGLFLVTLGGCGVAREAYVLPDGRAAERITFTDAEVAIENRVDDHEKTEVLIRAVFDEALLAAATETLGAMQALYDLSLEYAKTRRQFGHAIGTFQALQFRLVDMWIRPDESRSLVTSAAMALADRDPNAGRLATAAWIQSIWSGRALSEEAIQIHGAIGMTHDYAIAGYVKRILVNELLFGTADRHFRRYRLATSG
jgi:alkylation response protein AidB-like acyl-CoA dehydrogenase